MTEELYIDHTGELNDIVPVERYWDGTLLTPDNEAEYLGALYNVSNSGKYFYRGKPKFFALSTIFPEGPQEGISKSKLLKLFRDYNGTPFVLIVDVAVVVPHSAGNLTLLANATLLYLPGGSIVAHGGLTILGRDLSAYPALSGRPLVWNGSYQVPQGPLLYDLTTGQRYYGIVTPGGNSAEAKSGDVWLAVFRNAPGSNPSGIHMYNVENVNGAASTIIDFVTQSEFIHASRVAVRIKDIDNGLARMGINEEDPQEQLDLPGNVRGKAIIFRTGHYLFTGSGDPEGVKFGMKGCRWLNITTGKWWTKRADNSSFGWERDDTNYTVSTYAEMLAMVPGLELIKQVKVANDEAVNETNTIYQIWPDGIRMRLDGIVIN